MAAACAQAQVDTRECVRGLFARGIEVRPDELMREVALRHGMVPEELLDIMLKNQ